MDEKIKKGLIGNLDTFSKKLDELSGFFQKDTDDYTKLNMETFKKLKENVTKDFNDISSSAEVADRSTWSNIAEVYHSTIDKNMQIIIDNIELYKTAKTNNDLQRIYFILKSIMKMPHNNVKHNKEVMDKYSNSIKNAIESINGSIDQIKADIEKLKPVLNIAQGDKSSDLAPGRRSQTVALSDISDDKSHIDVISKVFPTPFVNSKGFRIGDYKVAVDTTALPFTNTDQVNHYLYNLFDYTNYQGIPKMTRKQERETESFFNAKKTKFEAYKPIKYPDAKKAKYIEKEQKILQEENLKIRENMRKIQNELAEMGFSGDPVKRAEIRNAIEAEIGKDKDKKETILSEYLNAIDEVEQGDKPFKLPFLTAVGENKDKAIAGGKRKTRGNQRKKRIFHKRNVTKRKQ